jgi:hypothetical protein
MINKFRMFGAVLFSLVVSTGYAQTITSVGAAYMAKSDLTGANFILKDKSVIVAKYANGTGSINVELLKSEVRVLSKTDPNGEWLSKLFLSVNDGINNYFFLITDKKVISIKSFKANEKAPNVLEIVVDLEDGTSGEYSVNLLTTPREDAPAHPKVFHIIRLTDKSPIPTKSTMIEKGSDMVAAPQPEAGGRSLTPSELPKTVLKRKSP